jgi:prophage regulatory protein
MAITIQRLIKAKESLGVSRSTFYLQIAEGLITRPVQIGARAVGWPNNEIEAIVNARIAGKNQNEIKALVKELESQRAQKAGA